MTEQRKLPTHEECAAKAHAGTATALEHFIHDNEPAGELQEKQFRAGLAAVLAEAAQPAPQRVAVPDAMPADRADWTMGQWAEHFGGRHKDENPLNYYEFGSLMAVAAMLQRFGLVQRQVGWNLCREAMLAAPQPTQQPAQVPDVLPDAVLDATAQAIGDAYDCMRVWEAWSVGTMGPLDFYQVVDDADRVDEIARAAITAYLTTDRKPKGAN